MILARRFRWRALAWWEVSISGMDLAEELDGDGITDISPHLFSHLHDFVITFRALRALLRGTFFICG